MSSQTTTDDAPLSAGNGLAIIQGQRTAEAGEGSMSERAYADVLRRLIMLDIRPGDPINESALATELGVGRTPLREALKRLELDQLVVSYPRRGTFATHVDITELQSIFEVRRVLEPLGARLAAERLTPGDREVFRRVADDIGQLDPSAMSRRELLEYDVDVHRVIYAATENTHLAGELIRLDNLVTRIWCVVLDRMPTISEHIVEHRALMEAIIDGDADRAADMVSAHVDGFEAAVRAVL
ncbi:GntR family transcriptional regulator [Helcobacillus massiliensis]|nr:GntR family transcriptional regulator [Helcobacillus massiliensis]WOO93250.1 GntR family transcriptional regulator [Helcobacillus massiliensis]